MGKGELQEAQEINEFVRNPLYKVVRIIVARQGPARDPCTYTMCLARIAWALLT
jgi:hypothetical protein